MYKASAKEQDYSLYGKLLGDGTYRCNGLVRVVHSNKQRGYVKWLERTAVRWGMRHTTRYDFWMGSNYVPGGTTNSKINLWFHDKNRVDIGGRYFTDEGRRIVSRYVADRMTPLGWLWLYLDNGNLGLGRAVDKHGTEHIKVRFADIYTERFDERSHENLLGALDRNYGVAAGLRSKKDGRLRLHFNATSFRGFVDLVRPLLVYVPADMLYKFDMQYDGVSHRVPNGLAYNLEHYLQVRGSADQPETVEDMT